LLPTQRRINGICSSRHADSELDYLTSAQSASTRSTARKNNIRHRPFSSYSVPYYDHIWRPPGGISISIILLGFVQTRTSYHHAIFKLDPCWAPVPGGLSSYQGYKDNVWRSENRHVVQALRVTALNSGRSGSSVTLQEQQKFLLEPIRSHVQPQSHTLLV
jgi:hypothetical protein